MKKPQHPNRKKTIEHLALKYNQHRQQTQAKYNQHRQQTQVNPNSDD
jgi:hypothetical protein